MTFPVFLLVPFFRYLKHITGCCSGLALPLLNIFNSISYTKRVLFHCVPNLTFNSCPPKGVCCNPLRVFVLFCFVLSCFVFVFVFVLFLFLFLFCFLFFVCLFAFVFVLVFWFLFLLFCFCFVFPIKLHQTQLRYHFYVLCASFDVYEVNFWAAVCVWGSSKRMVEVGWWEFHDFYFVFCPFIRYLTRYMLQTSDVDKNHYFLTYSAKNPASIPCFYGLF